MNNKIIIITIILLLLSSVSIYGQPTCFCGNQGDCNNDGDIFVSDLVYLIDYLFKGGIAPVADADCYSENRGDVNCDTTVLVDDLTFLVDYLFKGGYPPCDLCHFGSGIDPDSISYDYFIWYDTNMYNAMYNAGASAFYYVNNPGSVNEGQDYTFGDTLVKIDRKYLDADSGKFLQFYLYPGTLPRYDNNLIATCSNNNLHEKGDSWARFPTSLCKINGSTVNNSPIEVVGNRINVLGTSFSVDYPSTYGPPSLATQLAQSINNPPSPPTSDEVADLIAECGEIVAGIFNCRIISVFIVKDYRWTSDGISYHRVRTYDFDFQHYWYYECPDGPLEREMYCSVRITNKLWENGTQTDNYSTEAVYVHTF